MSGSMHAYTYRIDGQEVLTTVPAIDRLSLRHQSGRSWLARAVAAMRGYTYQDWFGPFGRLVLDKTKNPLGWGGSIGYIWRLSMCPVHATDEGDFDWRAGTGGVKLTRRGC